MDLKGLRVVHLPKTDHPMPAGLDRWLHSTFAPFTLETCQRQVWAFYDPSLEVPSFPVDAIRPDLHSSSEAYAFLLLLVTGLLSAIPGETDIFGQFKLAWQTFETAHTTEPATKALGILVQKLFEDTKEIRSLYLHGLGGSSYGSLARKIVRPENHHRIGVIGAGQIAESVLPFFIESELWIYNRSDTRLQTLQNTLKTQFPKIRISQTSSQEDELTDWLDEVDHLLICAPPLPLWDAEASSRWSEGSSQRKIVHFGIRSSDSNPWSLQNHCFTLDDLFDLQKTQDENRALQIARARRACYERARLRNLGMSLSIPHGWEDLIGYNWGES